MSEADEDRAYFYAQQAGEGPPLDLLAALRASIDAQPQVEVCEHCGRPVEPGLPHGRRWGACWVIGSVAEHKAALQTPELKRKAALQALTRATEAMNAANRGLFTATKRRAERRKEALAAGASVAEVQKAIKAGHRRESIHGADR